MFGFSNGFSDGFRVDEIFVLGDDIVFSVGLGR